MAQVAHRRRSAAGGPYRDAEADTETKPRVGLRCVTAVLLALGCPLTSSGAGVYRWSVQGLSQD